MKERLNRVFDHIKIRFGKEEPGIEYYEASPAGPFCTVKMALLSTVVFILYHRYAIATLLSREITDLSCHADFAQEFYLKAENFLKAWLRVPYMLWHLIVKFFQSRMGFPLSEAAAMVYALFGVFAFLVTAYLLYRFVKYTTGRELPIVCGLGSLILSVVGPYSMWWFSADLYYGQFSPNPFHNPTHMAVKGFGLLCAMYGIDIIRRYKGEATIFFRADKKLYLSFGVVLFFSALTKPTFMYMLLPAGGLYLIGDLLVNLIRKNGKASKTWGVIWRILVASIPSLLLLFAEYCAFYFWGTEQYASSVSFSSLFEVWHNFSYDVPTSVLLAMFFPIWMVVTNPGFFLRTIEGLLSLICYAVGTAEFSLIKETGGKTNAANFAWCMMAGMVVLFTISVAQLIRRTLEKKSTKAHVLYIGLSWFFLLLHTYSGYAFLHLMLKNYF